MHAEENEFFAEKCYVMLGCRENETALMFNVLLQLVDSENLEESKAREGPDDQLSSVRALACKTPALTKKVNVIGVANGEATGRSVLPVKSLFKSPLAILKATEAKTPSRLPMAPESKRHKLLTIIQAESRVPPHHISINTPRNQYTHAIKESKIFELQLPLRNAPAIKLPLPLPRVGGEWGIATLLLKIGGDSLTKVLHLMMLERNVLVLGEVVEEVRRKRDGSGSRIFVPFSHNLV
jgi:hypothetical protein